MHLGQLNPQDLTVELYYGTLDEDGQLTEGVALTMEQIDDVSDQHAKYAVNMPCLRSGMTGYTVRVMPHHAKLPDSRDMAMIRWA